MNFKRTIAFASVFAMSCSIFSGFPAGTFDLNMNFYVNAADSIAIDETNFPDAIFRSYVQENFDTDSDGVLSSDELSSVSKINVSDLGIESVKGIEFFTELVYLYCQNNNLTELDISNNASLNRLYCSHNQIKSLNVSNCPELTDFICSYNALENLDVSNNTKLDRLECQYNNMTSINVNNAEKLTRLVCFNNKLTELDVSDCVSLTRLECEFCNLTFLDLSNNTSLNVYGCYSNSYDIGGIIGSFDLSNLPGDFDATKASNWQGATYKNGILTNLSDVITYDYDLGNGKSETFTLTYSPKALAADDTSSLIDYTYNDDIYSVDVSKYIKIYANTEVDPLLDVNVTGTSDETVSPFDLYWSAYNSGNPTTGFNGTYAFDTNRIDELFDDINEEYGLDLSYDENSDLFIGILYDENGNAIDLGSFNCKVAQRGDANLDHTVDAKDASAIAKYTAQSAISSDVSMNSTDNELGVFAGDTNSDGTIDAKDAANIAKFTAQKALCSPDIPEAQSYWEIWNNILG
ncbi:MAG: hypothetical protein IJO29_09425 [Oscillospiraceae bacterium]|nr:hypothetical protein [Oscillospiraceae bacterium]